MSESLHSEVTGVVLAGGRGQRMGGADKGLLPYRGRALAAQVLDGLAPQVGPLLISANRNLDAYRLLGRPHGAEVIRDVVPGHAGPLAGLHAALTHSTTPWLVSTPCDMPDVPADLVGRLLQAARGAQRPAAVLCAGGRRQPTLSLLHRSLLPALTQALAASRLAAGRWLDEVGAVEVDAGPLPLAHFNLPEDLARHG